MIYKAIILWLNKFNNYFYSSGIQGERDDIQIHYKSDNTGYYIVAWGGTNAIVW